MSFTPRQGFVGLRPACLHDLAHYPRNEHKLKVFGGRFKKKGDPIKVSAAFFIASSWLSSLRLPLHPPRCQSPVSSEYTITPQEHCCMGSGNLLCIRAFLLLLRLHINEKEDLTAFPESVFSSLENKKSRYEMLQDDQKISGT